MDMENFLSTSYCLFDYYLSNTTHARQTENSCSSTILLISPLNALMLDQVKKLQKHVKVCILKEDNKEHKSDKTPRNTVEKIRRDCNCDQKKVQDIRSFVF